MVALKLTTLTTRTSKGNSFFLYKLQVERKNENILPYWLSNTSALLCLLQKNLRSNVFLKTPGRRSAGSTGLSGRMAQVSLIDENKRLVH